MGVPCSVSSSRGGSPPARSSSRMSSSGASLQRPESTQAKSLERSAASSTISRSRPIGSRIHVAVPSKPVPPGSSDSNSKRKRPSAAKQARSAPSTPFSFALPVPSSCTAASSRPTAVRARSRSESGASPPDAGNERPQEASSGRIMAPGLYLAVPARVSASSPARLRLLPVQLGRSPRDLLGRDVFLVRGDRPDVAEGIDDRARAVAVELVLQRPDELRARVDRLLHERVHVLHVQADA